MAVTEPSSDQNLTAAILTLSTDSGGALEVEVVVEVSSTDGSASEFLQLMLFVVDMD